MDLKINSNNDLIINHKGDFELVDNNIDYLKQKIKIELSMFYSEWFLDSEIGVSWTEMLGNKEFNEDKLSLYIKRKVELIDGIKSVEVLKSELKRFNKTCIITLKIKSKYGDIFLNNLALGAING
ncbi:MAG: hypothetical protein DCC88_00280 [Spirobacillus cienkowskii]|jgi:hypothetical protein|uniref:DUF2634 domain-containing protein n=1 Tax=Spirobacillus cienkowskii TaxID=495820 RepID=A0A369KX51_9BACT|nr:MAG: hypothetical protein DCC88_00280 [Spirobacillus cienkowskii]